MGGPLGTPDTAGGFQVLVLSETWPEDAIQKPSEGVLRCPKPRVPCGFAAFPCSRSSEWQDPTKGFEPGRRLGEVLTGGLTVARCCPGEGLTACLDLLLAMAR